MDEAVMKAHQALVAIDRYGVCTEAHRCESCQEHIKNIADALSQLERSVK